MINEVDRARREQIAEAADKIVEPFKKVVSVAMQRVRVGMINLLGGQRIAIYDISAKRMYRVTDISAKVKINGIRSLGELDSGLIIEGVQLNEKERGISTLTTVDLPREVSLVTKRGLFLQRGSDPEDVERLARELETGFEIGLGRFEDVAAEAIKEEDKGKS